jgi:ABC-type lipoprotein export system ATPase subunit
MLIIEKISKTFKHVNRDIPLFEDFSLNVQKGEFLALCGPSGCGKTTLMLMAGGLLAPDKGEVCLHGRELYSFSSAAGAEFRAENLGFVFQQFHLLQYLNVIDNILLPELAFLSKDTKRRANQLIEELGLSPRATHFPSELSIGERQRTALARALIHSPSLILADEPTGNLDSENTEIVISMLRKFADEGNSVIMVTHSRDAAEKTDRVIEL